MRRQERETMRASDLEETERLARLAREAIPLVARELKKLAPPAQATSQTMHQFVQSHLRHCAPSEEDITR